jgi:hypothetical protein
MRDADPAVIGRIEGERLLLDARTIADADVDTIVVAITSARTRV